VSSRSGVAELHCELLYPYTLLFTLMHRAMYLFTPQFVMIYTAGNRGGVGVNNLPKVVVRQYGNWESSS